MEKSQQTHWKKSNSPDTKGVTMLNSPHLRKVEDNADTIFSTVIFILIFSLICCTYYLISNSFNVWICVFAFSLAFISIFTIHIASQWERVIVLRFGKFNRVVEPGLFFTIPFFENIALRADQRIMLTGFEAEETLTADLVPANVDAVVFWMVWDAKKACLEVENYFDAVSLASQTALRDAIGRNTLSEIIIHRDKLDQELHDKIEEKTSTWGVSILSVEIRDISIPKELQQDMAITAKAERAKEARILLAEVESDVASMLLEATKLYQIDPMAFELRSMHLLSEGVKDSRGTVVIPSSYSEGFNHEK